MPASPMVRPVLFTDVDAVAALLRRNGVSTDHSGHDDWAAVWRDNPVMHDEPATAAGWVLDVDGRVSGYLGSVPLYYHFRGRRLRAAAARGLAVDADQRGHSVRLLAAFFGQRGVDLFLNTTANAAAGTVFQLGRAQRVPQPESDRVLFWVLDARGFAGSLLRKRGSHRVASAAGALLLAPAVAIESAIRRRWPVGAGSRFHTTVQSVADLGSDFEAFWVETLADRAGCVLADRSRVAMRWHFARPGTANRRAVVVAAYQDGAMVGYAVTTREDAPEIGLTRRRIVDLLARRDESAVIDALLGGCVEHARSEGVHILEVMGFPPSVRARVSEGRAHSRMLPAWPYWYKAGSSGLAADLGQAGAWHVSAYDGDASL